jgi:hypothetical protein
MRRRIALIAVVCFTLAGIGAITAAPASATIYYGTCSVTAVAPVLTNGNTIVSGRARFSCGTTTIFTYTLNVWSQYWPSLWSYPYGAESKTLTVPGGTVRYSQMTYGTPYQMNYSNKSRINFYGYQDVSQEWLLYP